MKTVGATDLVLITLSHNVSFTGKSWLVLMLCFRSLVVTSAGFSLFRDEGGVLVCNSLHPGCSNLCLNVFCPVSALRLWLFLLLLLLLPHLLFLSYLAHRVLSRAAPPPAPCRRAYACVVVLRMLLEAAFGVGQFLLFGFRLPRSFRCYEAPCTSGTECYVSRSTEKTLMLDVMLALAAASILLSACDLASCLRAPERGATPQATPTATPITAPRATPRATPRAPSVSRRSGQSLSCSDSLDHKRVWV